MRKKILLFLFIFPSLIYSQVITVDATTYTHEELIRDVLIGNNPCAVIENVVGITGTNFGNANGIGYFENTNPNFPIQSGIVLATGGVEDEIIGGNLVKGVQGPIEGNTFPGGGWPGDPQLFNYIQSLGIDPFLSSYNDATIMEFDFRPMTDSISFNFVFGSNEYGTYQCDFSDAFAFFLENQVTGDITNLAIVPGAPTETPISVTTIRDCLYYPGGNSCPNGSPCSMNEEYFDVFYGTNGEPTGTAPVNLQGHTVLMQAWSYVSPGNQYRMKLVIADRNDSSFDSAVFLEGGSFYLGLDLGEDLTIENGTAPCDQESVIIGVEPNTDPTVSYQWFSHNGTDFIPIPGETTSYLEVFIPGLYGLEVTYGNEGCEIFDDVIVEFAPKPTAYPPDPIILCDDDFPNDGFTDFNLTDRDAQIINGQPDCVVMYFETLALAENGDPADQLLSPFTNTIPWNQTVFARIEEISYGCYDITELELVVLESPDINTEPTDYYLCDDDQDGIELFDLTSKEFEIIGFLPGVTLTYHLTWEGAFNGVGDLPTPESYAGTDGTDIFVRVENDFNGCFRSEERRVGKECRFWWSKECQRKEEVSIARKCR